MSFDLSMTGNNNEYDSQGDPDAVNLVPSQQYLDRYVLYVDYTDANGNQPYDTQWDTTTTTVTAPIMARSAALASPRAPKEIA